MTWMGENINTFVGGKFVRPLLKNQSRKEQNWWVGRLAEL
jgi:hypothetical protein